MGRAGSVLSVFAGAVDSRLGGSSAWTDPRPRVIGADRRGPTGDPVTVTVIWTAGTHRDE